MTLLSSLSISSFVVVDLLLLFISCDSFLGMEVGVRALGIRFR